MTGVCKDKDDNGESKECQPHENLCFYTKTGKLPYDCLMIPGAETENGNCVHSKAVAAPDSYCVEV